MNPKPQYSHYPVMRSNNPIYYDSPNGLLPFGESSYEKLELSAAEKWPTSFVFPSDEARETRNPDVTLIRWAGYEIKCIKVVAGDNGEEARILVRSFYVLDSKRVGVTADSDLFDLVD